MKKIRPGAKLSLRITAKDIAAGGTQAQIIRRAWTRTYGAPAPRWVVPQALAAQSKKSMPGRVRHVVKGMTDAGHIVKCGEHYHLGGTTVEGFDVEHIAEGHAPILLPDGNEKTDKLTMAQVRRLIRATLEEKDRKAVAR